MSKHIISNELVHEIKINNEQGDSLVLNLDMGDMIQVNSITEMFNAFEQFKDMHEIKDNMTLEDFLAKTNVLAKQQKEVNLHLKEAFGDELLPKIFKGNGSFGQYIVFFEALEVEIGKAGIKIDDFVKESRKKDIVDNLQGHKPKNVL